jgi:hypothetical protein
MAGEAAFLVDRVLPCVPLRQYVLAFPYDLSGLAATRPEVLTYLSRAFWEALRHRYRAWAKSAGVARTSGAETGAVTGVHRAGSSLNLHVHFHTLCADGVYVEDEAEALRFVEAPPPTRGELEAMLTRIYERVMKWLNTRGLLRGDDDSHEGRELSPSEDLAQAAMQRGSLVTVASDGDDDGAQVASPPPSPVKLDAVVFERFNLHANVRVTADDDTARERLCRYLTRPPFALGRFRRLRDGTIAYRGKKVSRRRTTERRMDPVECLARLASLVAPPHYPLLRLHGVFGSRHRWRDRVVTKPPVATKSRDRETGCRLPHRDDAHWRTAHELPAKPGEGAERGALPRRDGQAALALTKPPAFSTASLLASGADELVGPNVLSLTPWQRLEHGALFASSSRIDWRSLLRRTFQLDLRFCPRCGGRLSVTAPNDLDRVLAALRRSRDPPDAAGAHLLPPNEPATPPSSTDSSALRPLSPTPAPHIQSPTRRPTIPPRLKHKPSPTRRAALTTPPR